MPEQTYTTESIIETRLLRELLSKIHGGVEVQTQRDVQAGDKGYRVALCLRAAGRLIVVESDGRQYHNFNDDRKRDIAMIDLGGITDVIRFRGSDITYQRDECARFLFLFFPFLADSSRSPLGLEEQQLASASLCHAKAQPIIRCVTHDMQAPWFDWQTCNLMQPTTHGKGMIVEFKSPYWGWKYEGPRTRRIGDIAESEIENMRAERGMAPRPESRKVTVDR